MIAEGDMSMTTLQLLMGPFGALIMAVAVIAALVKVVLPFMHEDLVKVRADARADNDKERSVFVSALESTNSRHADVVRRIIEDGKEREQRFQEREQRFLQAINCPMAAKHDHKREDDPPKDPRTPHRRQGDPEGQGR